LVLIYDGKNISAKGLELKKLSQSKLNEKELAHIIYTHNKVVTSGLPNYQGCKIPVKTRINVEFFGENLLDYKDKVICVTEHLGGKLKSKITLLSDAFLFVTEFNGELLN
jgi:glyoxylate utilization-related uncharacterized protein